MNYKKRILLCPVLFLMIALPGIAWSAADLAITCQDSPDPVAAGQSFIYTITITNQGDAPTSSTATLSDPMPFGLRFVSLSAPGWTCTTPAAGEGGHISCSSDHSIAVGAEETLVLTVQVDSLGAAGFEYSNTITVDLTEDPNTANNSITVATTIAPTAELAITKTGPSVVVYEATQVSYSITVQNNGPDAAASAVMTDPLPAGTSFVSLAAPEGWSCSLPDVGGGGTVSCTAASMAAGASAAFQLAVTLPELEAQTSFTNTASVTSALFDSDSANNASTADVSAVPYFCPMRVIPSRVRFFANMLFPIHAVIFIAEEGAEFSTTDRPVWSTSSIVTLLSLRFRPAAIIAFVFIRPFATEAIRHTVKLGDCQGSLEVYSAALGSAAQ